MKIRPIFLSILIIIGMLATLSEPSPARAAGRCYVNDDAAGANNGTSWADAYTSLQSALADSCSEIWVAAGIYKPDASNRLISFALKNATSIYGGFAGTETLLTQRDPVANVTTLSGDLNGDDSGLNDGLNTFGENSYHVVTSSSLSSSAVLDGFTITGGNANSFIGNNYLGGGMHNDNSSPTLTNLIFSNNYASSGGGMYIYYVGAPTLTNVTFIGNSAASEGGGLYMSTSSPTLTNVSFIDNHAFYYGGGIYAFYLGPVLTNVTFSGNTATNGGGFYNMSNAGYNAILTNVTFSGNTASTSGGGLYKNSTYSGTVLLNNVIIANNTGGDCVLESGTLDGASSNNLIEDASNACGLSDGANGNIVGSDPALGALTNNGGVTQTFLPAASSAAIDAGTNTGCPANDQRGLTRPQNSTCDIGAVERDVTAPTLDSFNAISPSTSLTIQVTAFTASDNIAVTGYKITESSTPPGASDSGWTASAPTTYTVGGDNTYTLYPWAKDRDGNISAAGSYATVLVDSTPPTVSSSTRADANPSNASSVNFTVIFSEPVNGVDTSDFDLTVSGVTGASITSVTGSGASRTVSVNTGSGEGSIQLNVLDDDSILDTTAGNLLNGAFSSGESYSMDKTAPSTDTFSATSPSTSLNIPITGFTASDNVAVTGYKITTSSTAPGANDSGWAASSPSTYTVGSDGAYTLYPWVKDAAGNVSALYGSPVSVSVDTTAPSTDTFSATSPSTSLNIPITGFTASDNVAVTGYKITVSSTAPGANDSGWTVSSPSTYTVGSDGAYTLYPWVKDAAGNVSPLFGSPVSVTVDATAPTVTSITQVTTSPTAKVSLEFLVTFSEDVQDITSADFSLTKTGITGESIVSVTGSGTTRTVTVNSGTGNGTIRLDIPNTASITDLAGNALAGLPFTSGQVYTINKTLTFTSNSTQDGWVLESGENTNAGATLNSTATTFNLGDDATKKQYRGILSFSTSSIPDTATITGVTLKVKQQAIIGGGNPVAVLQGFMVDLKTGFFGTSALQAADFQTTAGGVYGPFILKPVGGVYSINLTSGKAIINKLATKSGLTQIRLRFKLDDNNNAVANYLSLYSGNAPVGSQPQLVITYSIP